MTDLDARSAQTAETRGETRQASHVGLNRYIVLVRSVDESYEAHGIFGSMKSATRFANAFNAHVEQFEHDHPEASDGVAWAYPMPLNRIDRVLALMRSGLPALAAQLEAEART